MNWEQPSDSATALLEILQLPAVGPVKARRAALTATDESAASIRASFEHHWPAMRPTENTLAAAHREALAVVEACERHGIRILSIRDVLYPRLLRGISDAPPLLFVRGSILALNAAAVAIVGTREASERGLEIASFLARVAVQNEFVVVSGLARGIDTAGHRGALDAKGMTVAVLAHGLDTVAPSSNKELAAEIERNGGALVSEHPPGTPPRPPEFVRRNRIQSGLSLMSVIVESGVSGGAMHQAKFTKDQGRMLCAVISPNDGDGFRAEGSQHLVSVLGARPLSNSREFAFALREVKDTVGLREHATTR